MTTASIPSTFEEAHEVVKGLIRDFQAKESYYLNHEYQEAETRRDFIDKFFIALGWDVYHDVQKNPYEQEVKVESGIEIEGRHKRADYSFSLAPNYSAIKFYVEAKKPASGLDHDQFYFQTMRYSWTEGTPFSILTNFQEFRVLDCRYRPRVETALEHGIRDLKFYYLDFIEEDNFRKVYHLFSREAVLNGSLDKYFELCPKPRGKAVQKYLLPGGYKNFDEGFLVELDDYREALAKAYKEKNKSIEAYALTEAVQRTIDRLVFIRFLEDKLIEEKDYVSNFGNSSTVWKDFVAACRKLDPIYNGLIFHEHFIDGSAFHPPEDEVFGGICKDLCLKNSSYHFNAIPIDILGSIYERFLGKIIRLTDKQVKIVDKPEVKKAGGVYYTPEYIVKYIVANTVGFKINGRNPESIEKMNFIDISCGSGSFLLGVYDLLIRYHTEYYNKFPKQVKSGDVEEHEGILRLSLRKKRDILLNNIHGVDIDPQAVEVTQLSLYLKILEEETTASASQTRLAFKEALLPSLNKNIICGNSLIDSKNLNPDLFSSTDSDLNPMSFSIAFSIIMSEGGFDVVVGNPPWGADFREDEKEIFDRVYKLNSGKYESYIYFLERATDLLKENGLLGYIVPSYWISRSQTDALRNYLCGIFWPSHLHVLPENVFKGVKMDSCILIVSKSKTDKVSVCEIKRDDLEDSSSVKGITNRCHDVPISVWMENPAFRFNPRIGEKDVQLITKIGKNRTQLANIVEITQGLTLYRRSTLIEKFGKKKAEEIVTRRLFHSDHKKNKTFKKELLGEDVQRFFVKWNGESWVSYGPWLAHAVDERFFHGPRLIVQKLRNPMLKQRLVVGYLDDKETYSAGVLLNAVIRPSQKYSLYFLMGILNSKLINYWYRKTILDVSIRVFDLEKVPIPIINFNDEGISKHKNLETAVNQIVDVREKIEGADTDKDKNFLKRRFEELNADIDRQIYSLYGIDKSELELIEIEQNIKS